MKKERLFAVAAFFFMSIPVFTAVYAGEMEKDEKTDHVIVEEKIDLTGDGKKEIVQIVGIPFEKGTAFLKETYLQVQTSDGTNMKAELSGGYDPQVEFADFEQDGKKDIFISIATGGSGGLTNHFLYTIKNGNLAQLPLPEPLTISSQFKLNYKAEMTIENTGQTYKFNLKDRKEEYDRLGLYQNGRLNEPAELIVDPAFGTLKPILIKGNKYGLKGIQSVSGAYHADRIAFVESSWLYEINAWKLEYVKVRKMMPAR
ncbi:hypothetical protein J9303_20775 [Bacillaceae bacterium Marseille-Q3522]|nr:hypothetical protein [Bacillaceae bacterium Marseille-Q3522]